MSQKKPATTLQDPRTVQELPGYLWRTLDLPSFLLDTFFVICVVFDLNFFSGLRLSGWQYTISGNIGIMVLGCALYFGLGYLMGQQAYAWHKRLGMSLFSYFKSDKIGISGYLIYPLALYYLPMQMVGTLLFLPIYFDMLPISGILGALLGIPFGFLYAKEIAANIDRDSLNVKHSKNNLPEFFPAYAVIFFCAFPLEIDYRPRWGGSDRLFWALCGLLLSYIIFLAARAAIYKIKQFIETSRSADSITRNYSLGFNLFILILLLLIEYLLYTDMQARHYSSNGIKALFCIIGLLPFRLLTVFTPPLSPVNILAALSALILFVFDTQ